MQDKNGFIYLHRKILNNPYLNEKPFCKGYAWCILLSLTNRKVGYLQIKNGQKIKLIRGECGYSKKALADIFGWSRGKITRYLNELEKRKMIQQKIVANHTIIKVLKFNIYQNRQQTDIDIEQQKNSEMIQQKKSENNDYIYVSKFELEEMIQQKIEKTNTKTDTNNNNTIYSNNIYNSLSLIEDKKITKKEREILNNYVKRKKLAKTSIRAYVNALVKNDDYLDILKEEKERLIKLERQKAKESIPLAEKKEKTTPEEDAAGLKLLRETVQKIRKRG
nr:MAG TPA: replisome organizer [Caudoviricetes sp.]